MNRVVLIGNLVRDPELRSTNSGTSVCSFTVAVQRRRSASNGERQTDFFPVTAWGKTAEVCGEYLYKGAKAAISGSLQTRSYTDKNGNKREVTEIIAEDVEFLTPRSNSNNAYVAHNDMQPVSDDDEDLPI